jgi:hypothetical protein
MEISDSHTGFTPKIHTQLEGCQAKSADKISQLLKIFFESPDDGGNKHNFHIFLKNKGLQKRNS